MPTPRTTWQRQRARAGSLLRLGSILAGCAVASGLAVTAAETPAKPHEFSDRFSTAFGELRPLAQVENPNYPELIKKANSLIVTMKLTGYDLAVLNQFLADLYIRSGETLKAIKPIEDSFIGDYFAPETADRMRWVLVQLYMQEAGATNDEKLREQRLTQTRTVLEKWFANNKEPFLGAPEMETYGDAVSLYANALYYLKEYKLAYEQAKKLVHLSIEPKDQSWVLLFAAQQEIGLNSEAAETFELFIRKFPERKDYWLQLAQAYLNSDQTMRAILTYQRAQTHGFMNSPSDYLNVFSLYCRLDEFSRASELMTEWIKSGKVADNEDNWEYVSSCFASMRRDDQVRTVLNNVRTRFKTGNLDYQLAQYLWYDGKYKEGLDVAEIAWKKGGLKKPGRTALFLATANYEQRDFPKAEKYLKIATDSGDVSKNELDRATKIIRQAAEENAPKPPAATTTPTTGT